MRTGPTLATCHCESVTGPTRATVVAKRLFGIILLTIDACGACTKLGVALCAFVHVVSCRALLTNRADVNATDSDNYTPIRYKGTTVSKLGAILVSWFFY